MATSLLRLGRFGTLKDGWGSVRTPIAAAYCTKTEAPKKTAKKASTLETPDERAALLAHKTIVAFPTRLSTPGLLIQGVALGKLAQGVNPINERASASGEASAKESVTTSNVIEAELVVDDSAKAETESCDVGAAAKATSAKEDATSPSSADVKAKKDADATSSSSSSSDSDSDSDSDEEQPNNTEMPKPALQTKDKGGPKERPSDIEETPSDVKTSAGPEHVQPAVPGRFPEGSPKRSHVGTSVGSPVEAAVGSHVETSVGSPIGTAVGATEVTPEVCKVSSEPTFEKVPTSSKALASSEATIDPAPVLCTTESVQPQAEVIQEKESRLELSSKVINGIPEPVSNGGPEAAAESTPKVVLGSVPEVASEPNVETKAATETTEALAAAEVLVDAAPVITEAEEVPAEPDAAAAPEEAPATPAPAAPEPEPFDNTKYQNLQHHNYNIYTFVDMDVEMANYRLPQPSTGRPSPMH